MLKKKHFKKITNLYSATKRAGIDLAAEIASLSKKELTNITKKDIDEFTQGMSAEEIEQFNSFPADQQRAIIARLKENNKFLEKIANIIDKLIDNYDQLENEIDELIIADKGITKEELDELDVSDYFKTIKEVISENISFFTGVLSQKKTQ